MPGRWRAITMTEIRNGPYGILRKENHVSAAGDFPIRMLFNPATTDAAMV
jgi:hypothetical protein